MYVKVIKIHQDFPELRLQLYCQLFMVHNVEVSEFSLQQELLNTTNEN